jgi:hypothetical protein
MPAQGQLAAVLTAAVTAAALLVMLLRPARLATYLVDFYCYRPPDRCLGRHFQCSLCDKGAT